MCAMFLCGLRKFEGFENSHITTQVKWKSHSRKNLETAIHNFLPRRRWLTDTLWKFNKKTFIWFYSNNIFATLKLDQSIIRKNISKKYHLLRCLMAHLIHMFCVLSKRRGIDNEFQLFLPISWIRTKSNVLQTRKKGKC